MTANFLERTWPATLLILLAGFMTYSNTFHVPFVLDDKLAIIDNLGIRSLKDIYGGPPTRILGYFTFALNYHFGGLDVVGYHAVNLGTHLTSALLVYLLVRLTFRTPFLCRSSLESRKGLLALFTALLFVLHPVQTQAVTYIVQRLASLTTMFYLLAVVFYILARLNSEKLMEGGNWEAESGRRGASLRPELWASNLVPFFLLAFSIVAAVLAMKTKEISFTLPIAILLYELFFFQGAWKRRLPYLLPVMATLPIVPLTVLSIGEPIGDIISDAGGQLQADEADITRLNYLLTQFPVIATYLRLLFLPINQNLDYDYPVYTTFFTPPVFLSFLLLTVIFALAIYLFRRSRQPAKRHFQIAIASGQEPRPQVNGVCDYNIGADPAVRLVSFGIIWFFLTLSVESSLIPILDVIFEHRLYLPSFGAAAAFATFFLLCAQRYSRTVGPVLPMVIAVIMVASLALAAYNRNSTWSDIIRLWEDVVRKSPEKARGYNNLGVALTDAGRYPEAVEVLSRAIDIKPLHPHAYNNLGRVYILTGQTGAAISMLNKAIRFDAGYADAYVNMAAAFNVSGEYQEAIKLLERNSRFLKDKAEAHFQLGVAHASLGNWEAARRELVIVSRLNPGLASHLAGMPGMVSRLTK